MDLRQFHGKASHIISIVDPGDAGSLPNMGIAPERHLKIACDDVESRAEAKAHERAWPGSRCVAPTRAMVASALRFADKLTPLDNLVVHCMHGISRSPAIAFGILCQAHPDRPARELLFELLRLRRHAVPNELIVRHADELLGREGTMIQTLEAYQNHPEKYQ